MRRNYLIQRVLVFGLTALFVTATTSVAEAEFEFKETEDGVLISESGQPVLFYQRKTKSLDGKYARANYVHPLYGLDGEVLTEDFPKDHPHHRGIFWAWHYLAVGEKHLGDGWACKSFSWDVHNLELLKPKGDQSSVALRAHVHWKSALSKNEQGKIAPVVNETTTIRVYPREENSRAIDFEIALQALVPDVHLAGSQDVKGYGGFSARIKLPSDLAFRTHEGIQQPKRLAVSGGPWMDFTGSFSETTKPSGIAILCHPSIPGFPQPWIIRKTSKSMQNPVFPGREPVALSTDEPLVLRYRVIIHRGTGDDIDFNSLQRAFGANPRGK